MTNRFAAVVIASQRARQLTKGATPRIDGSRKPTVLAQQELAAGQLTPYIDSEPRIDGFGRTLGQPEALPPYTGQPVGMFALWANEVPWNDEEEQRKILKDRARKGAAAVQRNARGQFEASKAKDTPRDVEIRKEVAQLFAEAQHIGGR